MYDCKVKAVVSFWKLASIAISLTVFALGRITNKEEFAFMLVLRKSLKYPLV